MMRVLGIETATFVGSVAVVDESKVAAAYGWSVETTHSEHLMVAINWVLSGSDLSLKDLDAIAISIGPGSFTGLRIGLSTAKGLCFATGLPLIPVPTLDALASRVPFCKYQVCPMLDARKGEVYTCLYNTSGGNIRRLSEPEAIPPEFPLKRISRPTLFLGEGAAVYQEKILETLGTRAHFAPTDLSHPDAGSVTRLGIHKLRKGEKADLFSVEPLYLRRAEAKLGRKL